MTRKDQIKGIRLFSETTPEKTEFEDGFLIERRSVLWLPVLAATALLSSKNLLANGDSPLIKKSMSWDNFLKECLPKAVELHKDTTAQGQDAYLFWIASMAARLDRQTIPKAKLGKFKDLDPTVEFGVEYRGVPFFVVEWRMAPNAFHPPHNHPNASVCTVGLEGTARIRKFETVGATPDYSSAKKFSVRETSSEMIAAGRINTLSATRDNIHTFQVGKETARGIDISTFHGKNEGFSFLNIADKPFKEKEDLFEANWIKL